MIFTDRKITIRNGKSSIDAPVVLYRGDFEVSIRFTIMESKFRFKSGVNLVDSEKASYGQLAILAPYGGNVFSEVVKCEDGTVTFTLTKAMIDQLEEVGLYSFQIRLFDYYRESRVSIPPVEFGIEVREPVASEDHDNSVNNAIVGYSIAKVVDPKEEDVGDTFDAKGQYNKTLWKTGDRISQGKLNKIEDALDKINQNEIADVAALDKRVTNNFKTLDANKADKNEIFSMKNMGQDVKEAMTGGSVAVVGKNAVLSENIVDGQVNGFKIADKSLEYRHFASTANVYNPNTCEINKIFNPNSNGELINSTGYCVTDYIWVNKGERIAIADGRITQLIACYDENKVYVTFVGGTPVGSENGPFEHIFNDDYYIRININMNGPFYENFYITKGADRGAIQWLEVQPENLTSDVKKTIDDLKDVALFPGIIKRQAISGFIVGNNTDGINLINIDTIDTNNYLISNGGVAPNDRFSTPLYCTDFIEVEPNTIYTNCVSAPTQPLIVEYDENKKLITYQTGVPSDANSAAEKFTFTTASNTKYVRLNVTPNVCPLDSYYFIKGTEYVPNKIVLNPGNLFDKENVVNGELVNHLGEFIPNNAYPHIFRTGYIQVAPNHRIKLNFNEVTDWLVEYDENKNFIKRNLGYNTDNIILSKDTNYIVLNINTNTITLDDFYIVYDDIISVDTYDWLEARLALLSNSGPSGPSEPGGSSSDIITSRFNGMRVLVTGDSITEKNFRCTLNWHDYLKEWYGWSKVHNDGRSGAGLVKNTGIVHRLPTWETKYGSASDIDMILIMGPMNDGTSGVTGTPEWLGTFEDQSEDMKTMSLYGALHYTCTEILRMYPNIPVGFIISQPRSQVGDQGKCWGRDSWFEKWVDAINEVCGHYSIPVLDLYHNSGLRPWIPENNKKYFSCASSPNGDGIHPNDLGQELMARKIYEFINRYM